jgi:polyisoprenyl-teichoic acid--peptidoglycan teichoic acid transferase
MRTREKSKAAKFFSNAFYGVWCVGALGFGSMMGWVGKSDAMTTFVRGAILRTPPKQAFENDSVVYILLLGCDENRSFINQAVTEQAARSDMMLCARIDFERNQITALSVPRDLLVELPGYRARKVNAYHEIGGKDLAKKAVEKVLGIEIDKVSTLDYKAFQRMVDLVGGVEMYVPKDMKWTDKAGDLYIDLKEGRQVLNGYNSMCFVRFRHSDSDYERQKRQKDFLIAFKTRVMSDPWKLPALTNEAVNLLGGGLTADELQALMRFSQSVGQDNIRMSMIPVTDHRNSAYGWYQTLQERELAKTLRDYKFVESRYAAAPDDLADTNTDPESETGVRVR